MDDEVVVVISPNELKLFKLVLAHLLERLDEAEAITLEWLDKKREEFP